MKGTSRFALAALTTLAAFLSLTSENRAQEVVSNFYGFDVMMMAIPPTSGLTSSPAP
jgi:hypothetical protein